MRRVRAIVAASIVAFAAIASLSVDARGDGEKPSRQKCLAACLELVGAYPDACAESPACRAPCSKDGDNASCKACVDKCVEPHTKAAQACMKKCG